MEKKIIMIVSIVIGIILLIGIGKLIYDQVKPSNPNRLEAEYIGENHIVGQELTIDEFKIQEIYNEQTYPIDAKQVEISDNVLSEKGAAVKLSFVNREGKTLTTTVNVACITTISYVEVTPIEDMEYYIDYEAQPNQFIMTAYNEEGYSAIVPPDFYTILNPVMDSETFDFEFEFVNYDGYVYNPICTVTNGIEMYVKEMTAKYVGKTKYFGEKVEPEEFEVTSILGNNEEFVLEPDMIQIENPYLEDAFNQVTVFFTNANGTKASTTVEVPAQNYCTSISTAIFIGNPKSVGDTINPNEIEVTGKFYDGDLKQITGFQISNNTLTENKNKVELRYTNEVGEMLTCEVDIDAAENLLFIGDERIHDLEFDVGDNGEKAYFVSAPNADLEWLTKEGIAKANSIIEQNSLTSFRIVFMIGIEDMDKVDEYIATYKKLGNDIWAGKEDHVKQRIYVASITPVDEELIAEGNTYDKNVYKNSSIKTFNDKLNEGLKNEKNVKYINTYGQMINGHLLTTDGFLLDTESNEYYYELVKALSK